MSRTSLAVLPFLLAALFIICGVVAWRVVFGWVSRRAAPRERLLLVGTGAAAVELARELHHRRQELGVDIVGFVDPDPARVGAAVINPGVVGSIDEEGGHERPPGSLKP